MILAAYNSVYFQKMSYVWFGMSLAKSSAEHIFIEIQLIIRLTQAEWTIFKGIC